MFAPKAILFDVDGTLYRQGLLRQQMLKELMLACLRNPLKGLQTLRIVYVFRRERECLRQKVGTDPVFLEAEQYFLPAQKLGVPEKLVRQVVQEWIYERPLKYLRTCKIPGLDRFLELCRSKGIKTGIFSDYPAQEKLEALGIAHLMDLVLCATEAEINAFKPSPRGLEVALARLGLSPEEVLYVGDRLEVDGRCAQALGIPFVLMVNRPRKDPDVPQVRDYEELKALLFS